MSVDKFGRRSNRKRPERGPKGDGFKLTPEGDYDIQNKRLRFLDDPVDSQDGVNLKTLQEGLFKCMQITGNDADFDAQMKRVVNACDPLEGTDLVTKHYLHGHIPEEEDQFWSFKQKRLSNVASPLYDGEAVNLEYIKNNTIMKDRNNFYDAKSSVITNLAPPVGNSDAINKGYLDNNALVSKNGQVWDFRNRRLINVKDPEGEPNDVVNIGFLDSYALCRSSGRRGDGDWDARGLRIRYAGLPSEGGDVVTKLYLQHQMANLSYEIYKQITSIINKDSTLYDYDKWYSKVFITPWAELFKIGSREVKSADFLDSVMTLK